MSQPATLLSAVPVPFETNGDLDVKGQETLLRHLKDTGIPGVFIAGTTGEFTALDDDERGAVLAAALEVYGADSVYAHVGAAAARQAERLTTRAVALGAQNLAAITPFYLLTGPAALIDYYRRLDAVAGDARIYIYLYAARSGSTVTPDQLTELAKIPSVAGAKISGEPTSVVLQYDQAAAAAQDRIKQAVDAVGGADIALLKVGLSLQGLPAGPTRVALDQPTPAQLEILRAAVQDLT